MCGLNWRCLYVSCSTILISSIPAIDQTGLTSTCSLDQLSMLNDLTFDMCVPSLRWSEAHRIHRNMPSWL